MGLSDRNIRRKSEQILSETRTSAEIVTVIMTFIRVFLQVPQDLQDLSVRQVLNPVDSVSYVLSVNSRAHIELDHGRSVFIGLQEHRIVGVDLFHPFQNRITCLFARQRAQYPDRFAAMKRQSWDIMLDHRLNPDDISRTTPPVIEDLIYARSRGMNRFNILNIVPQPKNPNVKWICYSPPSATEDPAFYPAFKARLDPYMDELRRHGLEKFAYIYGFDERQKEYYPGIDALWRKLKRDFPDIPVMTTAMMYRDMVKGHTDIPCLMTTDWYCPLTPDYNLELSEKLRKQGKQVWWYTCCGPQYPYANMSSLEYPWIEGRLLGWMTHLYRSDGLLFWHVNYWNNNACVDESDTFFPFWHTYSGLHMPGDGIFLYPGKTNILPSIRLAQVRDGVEDYEWLQLATAKAGPDAADAESRTIIQSMTKFSRDPAALRAARSRLADVIEKAAATP